MLARRLTTILPAMTLAEAIETTRMHGGAGLTGDRTALVTTHPFRTPSPLQITRDYSPSNHSTVWICSSACRATHALTLPAWHAMRRGWELVRLWLALTMGAAIALSLSC
jgi:Magnesium chelatase, subunit ChlI